MKTKVKQSSDQSEKVLLPVGTTIDFVDVGTGRITKRRGNEVYLKMPGFSGWCDEAALFADLEPND